MPRNYDWARIPYWASHARSRGLHGETEFRDKQTQDGILTVLIIDECYYVICAYDKPAPPHVLVRLHTRHVPGSSTLVIEVCHPSSKMRQEIAPEYGRKLRVVIRPAPR